MEAIAEWVEDFEEFIHTVSDGKVTRLDMFASKARALDAAGLRE